MSITIIMVFMMTSMILSGLIMLVNYLIATKSFYKEKVSAYECGFSPFGSSRDLFDVHFYMISILFIMFDLEIVFLFPWAMNLMTISNIGNNAVVMFLMILAIGLFYEWNLGMLHWKSYLL